LILPGVGAFDWAMARLNASGMRDTLDDLVINKQVPILGICVGMQMMGRRSDEGSLPGTGWIDGDVKKFDTTIFKDRTHLPHMGWNTVVPRHTNCLFSGMGTDARFYFLHSYFFDAVEQRDVLGVTDYYGEYASSIRKGNIFGTQFHPEKSHRWGIRLLKNFAELGEC